MLSSRIILIAFLMLLFFAFSYADNYCVGATANFTCNQNVNQSCTMNGNLNATGTNCFNVTASNVSINCAGFALSGNNTFNTYGIYSTQTNTTVKNCNIDGFDVGIYYTGASATNGLIENNNVNSTVNSYVAPLYSSAITLYSNANGNAINNNTAYSQVGFGIFLPSSSNNLVSNSVGTGKGGGILNYVNSHNNQILNSTGISSTGYGIWVYGSNNNSIVNSIGNTSATSGIRFDGASNSSIINSSGIAATSHGIWLADSSSNNIINSNGTAGTSAGIYLINSNNNNITNSIGAAGTDGAFYIQASSNNIIINSTSISATSYSLFIYAASNNNTFTNCQIKGKHNGYGALLIYGSNYNNTIANSTINGLGATYAASLQAGTLTGNQFINNILLNATNLLLFDAGASNNIICLNNFSDSGTSPTTYVTDSNGSNSYSCTYDGKNQGNIYPNVLNGSVEIKGSVNSSIGGLYIGASGAGYPYNSTNSLGKITGGVDYAPLTNQLTNVNLTIQSPMNQSYSYTLIDLNYTAIDASECGYILNGGPNIPLITCLNTTITAIEGNNNVTVYMNDTSNIFGSTTVSFYVDSLPPNISIQSPNDSIYDVDSVGLNYTAVDSLGLDSCWYSLDGNTTSLPNCLNITLLNLSVGAHFLVLYANDSLNNIGSASVNFSVSSCAVVITPPDIYIDSPINAIYHSEVSLNYRVVTAGPVTECHYVLDNGSDINLTSCLNTSILGLNNSFHIIRVYATACYLTGVSFDVGFYYDSTGSQTQIVCNKIAESDDTGVVGFGIIVSIGALMWFITKKESKVVN